MIWETWSYGDTVIGGLVGVLVLALWLALVVLVSMHHARRRQRVRRQLGVVDAAGPTREIRLWHDGQEAHTTVPGAPRRGPLQRVEHLRKDAGVDLPAHTLVLGGTGTAAALALLLYAISGSLVLPLIALVAVPVAMQMFLRARARKRQNVFEQQLMDGLELASRSLRAGHGLLASLRVIAEEIDAPVGTIFQQICQMQTMGVGLEDALGRTARECEHPDMRLFATSIAIQLRSGGNLADMIHRLAAVIRDRVRLNRHVRVLTAQAQLSKRILLVLPFLLFAMIAVINPRYIEPLYATPTGRMMGIAAVVSLIVGAWIMNRMVRLNY